MILDTLTPKDLTTLEKLGMIRVLRHDPPNEVTYELTHMGRVLVERILDGKNGTENTGAPRSGRGLANARRRVGHTP